MHRENSQELWFTSYLKAYSVSVKVPPFIPCLVILAHKRNMRPLQSLSPLPAAPKYSLEVLCSGIVWTWPHCNLNSYKVLRLKIILTDKKPVSDWNWKFQVLLPSSATSVQKVSPNSTLTKSKPYCYQDNLLYSTGKDEVPARVHLAGGPS